MTHEEFEALVARLEASARRDPGRYRLRVILMALAGYGYLGFVLVLLLGLFAASLASTAYLHALGVKLAIAVGIIVWVVLRALWIKFVPPPGLEVRRDDAPALFAMVEGLRARLGSKRFHHVLVTREFNAGVVQVPLLGMFGWHRNYLLVGLPLMRYLTPEQLEAVLAHEFGHLAGGHARLSNWIYRLRLSFQRLIWVFEEREGLATYLFKPFFASYAPYFNAYSFPLARANEYEADAAAARLVSPGTMAQALTNVAVVALYLDNRYWPAIHRKADELPQPAFTPYASMGAPPADTVPEAEWHEWLKAALASPTTVDDTHPGLADRLKAMGAEARIGAARPGEAADALLGPSRARITAHFDAQWKEAIAPSWEQRHNEVREGKRRLEELGALAAQAELPLDEAFEHARLDEAFGAGPDAALARLRRIHEREPHHPLGLFLLGLRLLARDDAAGVAMLEEAMALDGEAILPASHALRDYFWRIGRKDEANAWHARIEERARLMEAVRKERGYVRTTDKFERHGLSAEVVAGLREQLRAIPGLRKAYFVRKRVKHLAEKPLFILAHRVTPFWRWRRKGEVARVQEAIVKIVFPHETLVLNIEGENEAFAGKFRYMRGSRIL